MEDKTWDADGTSGTADRLGQGGACERYSKIYSLERENENLNKELHEKTKELLAGMSEKSELMQNVAEIEYTNAHFGALEAQRRQHIQEVYELNYSLIAYRDAL